MFKYVIIVKVYFFPCMHIIVLMVEYNNQARMLLLLWLHDYVHGCYHYNGHVHACYRCSG